MLARMVIQLYGAAQCLREWISGNKRLRKCLRAWIFACANEYLVTRDCTIACAHGYSVANHEGECVCPLTKPLEHTLSVAHFWVLVLRRILFETFENRFTPKPLIRATFLWHSRNFAHCAGLAQALVLLALLLSRLDKHSPEDAVANDSHCPTVLWCSWNSIN